MLTTVKNAFKIKEIRNKVFFTFLMLVVIRLGSQLPVPGVDRHYFSNWFAAQTGDAFNFLDAFFVPQYVHFSIKYYSIHHILHYHAASYNSDSETGRNAA